tara:strand:- start:404 stop:520 length:117 start_codon:yes stop_codon:yes gene_type:complete
MKGKLLSTTILAKNTENYPFYESSAMIIMEKYKELTKI